MKNFVKKTFYVNKNNVIVACKFKEFKVSKPYPNRFYIKLAVEYADGTESAMCNGLEFGERNYGPFHIHLFETKEDAVRKENEVIEVSDRAYLRKDISGIFYNSFCEVDRENPKWYWNGLKAVQVDIHSVDFVSGTITRFKPTDAKSRGYATKEECEWDNSIQYIDFPQDEDENAKEKTLKAIEETEQKISELKEKLSALKRAL